MLFLHRLDLEAFLDAQVAEQVSAQPLVDLGTGGLELGLERLESLVRGRSDGDLTPLITRSAISCSSSTELVARARSALILEVTYIRVATANSPTRDVAVVMARSRCCSER
jgi:hypothetical protein